MTEARYHRKDIARWQLETAVRLFLVGRDRSSVITLAGKETRAAHGREINDTLFINDLKHMDEGEDGYVTMDVDGCALGAILKALANYVAIAGRDKDFVKAFLAWVQLNLDPKKYNIYCDPNWNPST